MAGQTVWGAYNAVTNHITHDATRDDEKRLQGQWYGYTRNTSQKAFDLAMSLVA
jgi:hypothetical protein